MSKTLPYAGLRVVEFTHMVMGPSCGLVLADLGAEVIKVEPPKGDNTRRLLGSGAGFYPLFNRNKKSLVLDLHSPEGHAAALRLIATADVLSENFKDGTMRQLGLDYETLSQRHPRLVKVGRGLSGQRNGPGGDRRHDQGLARQYARRLREDIGPALGREHQVATHVLTPLVVLPALQQGIVIQQRFGLLVLPVIHQRTGQCDSGVRRFGHGDRQVGTGFQHGSESNPQPIGLPVQPRPVCVKILQRRQLVVTRRDPSQPSISHRRVDLRRIPEKSACGAGFGFQHCHGLIEMTPRGNSRRPA